MSNVMEFSGHQTRIQGHLAGFTLEAPICLQSLAPHRCPIMPPCWLQNGLVLYHGETEEDYGSQADLSFASIFYLGFRPIEHPWNSVMEAAIVTEILGKTLVSKSSGFLYMGDGL